MKTKFTSAWLCAALWLAAGSSARAQWQTQSILVKPGWSAIYVHVDASYSPLDTLVGGDINNPIRELWYWNVSGNTAQYVTSPQTPLTTSSQWLEWERVGTGLPSSLATLVPNGAYLVHSTATTNYTWNIKGKPVAPSYFWSTTGENFLDFPTVVNNPPAMDAFFALAPSLESMAQVYAYGGGQLGANNPTNDFSLHNTPVVRGQAFWIQTPNYFNNYYGPFTAVIPNSSGAAFSNVLSQFSFHLQNPTSTNVTVTLSLAPSETPPTGQTPIVTVPPLMVRGALVTSNLTYSYTNLTVNNTISWSLPPTGVQGSDLVVVIGLNRYNMLASPGSLYAGILKLTDSFGFTEVDVPVSAVVSDYTGLWVGNAVVSQVANYLKIYQMDGNNQPIVGTNGAYIVSSVNTNLGNVQQSFSLRLIVHNDGTHVNLLQRVFSGMDPFTNSILALNEGSLDPNQLGTARRISAIHLPWQATNAPFPMTGQLVPGGTVVTSPAINFDYGDQSSNPFLHTYHPDHDNLDALFQTQLPVGSESYGIQRQITLAIMPPNNDFMSLTQAGQAFVGSYVETMTMVGLGGATRTFNTAGTFGLTRISAISTLKP